MVSAQSRVCLKCMRYAGVFTSHHASEQTRHRRSAGGLVAWAIHVGSQMERAHDLSSSLHSVGSEGVMSFSMTGRKFT